MYIVVIAWLYVVILMSVLEKSFIGGLMTLSFYGLLPLAILLYLTGTPRRWKRKKQAELATQKPISESALADQPVSQANRSDPEQN